MKGLRICRHDAGFYYLTNIILNVTVTQTINDEITKTKEGRRNTHRSAQSDGCKWKGKTHSSEGRFKAAYHKVFSKTR